MGGSGSQWTSQPVSLKLEALNESVVMLEKTVPLHTNVQFWKRSGAAQACGRTREGVS
jgi:hypothetical protein